MPQSQLSADVLHPDDATLAAADELIRLGLHEDLQDVGDLTSAAVIPADAQAAVDVVAREPGVLCGSPLIAATYRRLSDAVTVDVRIPDGARLQRGTVVATVQGPVRALLTGERTVLNLLCHLSGIATLTAAFADAITGCSAVILDTRKTLPGYRRLHKYAVRCGGGHNHRMGLFDGILIKDNHLASRSDASPATAVSEARRWLTESGRAMPVEVEVDSLDQLRQVLPAGPDIVLLDNMTPEQLANAVVLRDRLAPGTQLEASGGITLTTVRATAESGVDRISVGGLTHSAPALDLSYDWPTDDRRPSG